MKPLITPNDMRAMEQRYFKETGTASIDLMERAARELCEGIIRRWGRGRTVFFACGPGGNGGDGLACARMYRRLGGDAGIFLAALPASPDAVQNLQLAREAGVPEYTAEDNPLAPDVWVDALYGTGLSRAPSGEAARLIERMNADRARGSKVAAVDIPSGLHGLTGSAFLPCARADATFTFQYAKPGCFLGDGLDMAGEVEVLDIGVPQSYYPDNQPALIDDGDVRRFLPPRPRNFHKGNGGHLLIVAGSFGMAGAAALAARSALQSGAGLVTVACPESIVPVLQTLAPCAMCLPLPEKDGALSAEAAEALAPALSGKSAVACGCGLSLRAAPEVVRAVLECGLPALFDADALNLIARDASLRKALRPHHLITPHPGEAARLLGRAVTEPIEDAFALRTLGCQVLLKGAATVIPVGGRAAISASGGCGMAKGGSGDCLTGVAASLMAQAQAASRGSGRFSGGLTGAALAECAAVASELHGLAGALAQSRRGVRGMTAMDLIEALPEVFMRYE